MVHWSFEILSQDVSFRSAAFQKKSESNLSNHNLEPGRSNYDQKMIIQPTSDKSAILQTLVDTASGTRY